MLWIRGLLIITLGFCVWVSLAVASSAESDNFESCHLDGWGSSLLCTDLPVGEGDTAVDLAVMIAPAVNDIGREPIYLLAGGPGQAASHLTPILNALHKVNQDRAIVLVDRRGSGYSGAFDCGINREITMDLGVVSERLSECYLEKTTFANALNSRQAVEDLEKVRIHLGHGKIALWGGSWGTRTALLYQQWYPDSLSVLILDAVAPIDTKVFLTARAAENALRKLELDCSEDPICAELGNWRVELDQLLVSWDKSGGANFPDPRSGDRLKVDIPRSFLQNLIRTALYAPETAAQIPFAVSQAGSGNYLPLSGLAGLLSDSGMSVGLTLSVACAEELNRTSSEELAADSRGSFLGTAFFEFFEEGCRVWPVAPFSYKKPEPRNHPVLLISGEADPITPYYYADQNLNYLSGAKHLLVPGGGHINTMRGCVPELIKIFLNSPSEALDTACLDDIQRPPFMVGFFGPEIDIPKTKEKVRVQEGSL
ncbi:alpha/beta hydrolase [Microbulbifer sp. OS29]|uniref:Proline iminopeptidase n=1 Tax=Microbulbifer okhotskensis TaxID=2926617 RepID=A0A9X2EMH9_9GAMM|nr:alpha/beta fold hydrolase [Microbulbifer okhotskensis]MCO1334315.1 alpha/beta hydrolase [Microbulbifer okhotskensis]